MPRDGKLKNLRINRVSAPGAGNSLTYTVRKNGVNGAVTATMSGTATTVGDAVNVLAAVAGDLIEVQISARAGTPAAAQTSITLEFTT
jgi:hypothetical protein